MYARVETDDLRALPDGDLVRRYRLGDDEALEALLSRHSDALYRFCCHLMSNREDAEDICQETLTRAMTRVESLQTGAAFRSWLFSIARNLSVDSFRSRKRISPLPDEETSPLPLYESGPHERIEAGEERETVALAMSQLRESHRRVLILREVEGLSYAEIARTLDVSQSAVETLLFRARRRLREEYSKREMPLGGLVIAGGIRDLLLRLASPFAGGPPLAAKLTVSAALVAGAGALVPSAMPPQPRALVSYRPGAPRAAHSRPQHAVAPAIHAPAAARPSARPIVHVHAPVRPLARGPSYPAVHRHVAASAAHRRSRSVHLSVRTKKPLSIHRPQRRASARWTPNAARSATARAAVQQPRAPATPPANATSSGSVLPTGGTRALSFTPSAPVSAQNVGAGSSQVLQGVPAPHPPAPEHVSGKDAGRAKHAQTAGAPAAEHGRATQILTSRPDGRGAQPSGAREPQDVRAPVSATAGGETGAVRHGRGRGASRSGVQSPQGSTSPAGRNGANRAEPGANGQVRGHENSSVAAQPQHRAAPRPAIPSGAASPAAPAAPHGHATAGAPTLRQQPASPAAGTEPQPVSAVPQPTAVPLTSPQGQTAPSAPVGSPGASAPSPDHGRADAPGQVDKGTPSAQSLPAVGATPQASADPQKGHGKPHP